MVGHKAQNVSAKPRTEDIEIAEETDFKSMLLPQPILKGLKKSGYIRPSPIQKKALPLVRCGLDLIVQAKAGTGKTCVFTVAVLELVKPNLPHLQAVVLAPTREIALQITSVIKAIGQCVEGLKVECFIGGFPLSVDVSKVKGCHVAVAAPGRLKHLLDVGMLNPCHVRLLVLDEADKLMEKVFSKDIKEIFAQLPESKQLIACSATYTGELVEFLGSYMNAGQYVSPQQTNSSTVLLGVRQFVSVIPRHVDRLAQLKLKEKHLLFLLQSISFNQCLIFSNLHTRAVSLCNLLRTDGWGVEWIAGRQEQKDRVEALTQLRDQRVRVLVTTDLTSRGIDVENVNLVINLDLPNDHHTYLHRMGRAGRYGSHGIVITVVSDGLELTGLQKLIGHIGGTALTVNCVPQNLKNMDLWKTSDEKFEKVCGIVDNKQLAHIEKVKDISNGSAKKSSSKNKHNQNLEDNSTSRAAAEKNTPESSDSEDYVKEYKESNGVSASKKISSKSRASDDVEDSSTSTAEKNSPESSDSEDYVKEYKESNGVSESKKISCVRRASNDVVDSSTSTAEKNSPESSDSEDYVKEYKGSNGVTASEKIFSKSRDSDDVEDSSTSTAEKNSPESSDSEDNLKALAGEICVGHTNGAGNVPVMTEMNHCGNNNAYSKKSKGHQAENSSVTLEASTSTDEKCSPGSSDNELPADKCTEEKTVISDYSCVCNTFKADAADIKLIAGPSLFALKTEEHWREVLPVVVNEAKIPLNTPIASLDSKLIRVRFWDKSTKLGSDMKDNISIQGESLIHFGRKSENNVFLNFQEISSYLENGIIVEDPYGNTFEDTNKPLMSFQSIEEALENGCGEINLGSLENFNEVDRVLMRYNAIKERSERALICFDSFDLVGWLAVDKLHNIIEKINIDECEVFEFKLVTCLAGENHIEVMSLPKGSSKEMNDYIDYFTTYDVESILVSTPVSLPNIAQLFDQDPSNLSSKLLDDSHISLTKSKKSKQTKLEKHKSNSHKPKPVDATVYSLRENRFKDPLANGNNKEYTANKHVATNTKNEPENCNSSSLKSTVTSCASKRSDQMKCNPRSIWNSSCKKKTFSEYSNMSCRDQVMKNIKKTSSQTNSSSKQHHVSSGNSDNSGTYVDMSWKPYKNVHAVDGNKTLSFDTDSLGAKSKNNYSKPKSNDMKRHNGIEHSTRKHRNSDDSYDSYDSVEYETTDLDKKLFHVVPNESQRKHHLTKHQTSTKEAFAESYDSHKYCIPKLDKPQVLHHRSKPNNYRNKQSYKKSQDIYSSNEYETGTPSFQSPSVTSSEEREMKSNYQLPVKHKTSQQLQDGNEESFDSSIKLEILKLREQIAEQDQFKIMNRPHKDLKYNKVANESDERASVESGGTNRHSFKTACSQHSSEDGESPSKIDQERHFNFNSQLQDYSNLPGSGSSHILRGKNLHEKWYTEWYLQVRQKAMQLAMMDYTKNMSSQ